MKKHKKNKKLSIIFIGMLALLGCAIVVAGMLFFMPQRAGTFGSLSKIKEHAQTIKEYPVIDNANWFNPDYGSYYKSLQPTFMEIVLTKLHIKEQPEWSFNLFHDLLEQVTREREKRELSGMCVQAYEPREHDRFFVWTELQGAFHSLVRCLVHLQEQEVISEDLTIKERCYFVFNGNVLDYGPTILRTFTLVLKLMSINPEQVFFVRSNNEQKGGWYDTKLAQELRALKRTDSDEVVPYIDEIDAFLNTLPDALYLLQLQDDAYQAIEILSMPEKQDTRLAKCNSAQLNVQQDEPMMVQYDNSDGMLNNKKIKVRALITKPESIKRMLSHPDGLTPLGMDGDAFRWATFSSPTGRSHQIYQFFFDTIVEINTAGSIEQWTISEYRDDVRDQHGFESGGTYSLVSGLRPGDEQRIEKLREQIESTKKELEEAKHKCAQGE